MGSCRSRAQTRPRLERECRAPRGAACSLAAAGPTRRARPQTGARRPPWASPPAGPPAGQPWRPNSGSPVQRARTHGPGRQGRGLHEPDQPSDAGTQRHTVDGSSTSGHLSRKRGWCPRNRGNFSSVAPMQAANGRLASTPSLKPPSSTASIQKPTLRTSSAVSTIIQRSRSTSYCLGAGSKHRRNPDTPRPAADAYDDQVRHLGVGLAESREAAFAAAQEAQAYLMEDAFYPAIAGPTRT
jgi:hypothetical protein